jgi:hypothetical protein
MPRPAAFAIALVLALAALPLAWASTNAQAATPAADARFADTLGLPELAITATDDGFEGVPAETEAGRYLVTFTNDAAGEAAEGGLGFMRLPEGRTVDDLAAAAEALGELMAGGSPAAMAGGEDPLTWVYETYIAGGLAAGPGGTGQAIVDLRPGDYAVWGDDPALPIPPVAMTVSGEMPADPPEPEARLTVTELGTADGYAFEVEGDLAPGLQTLRIDNKSDQPHFVVLLRSPEPITEEQLTALLELPEDAAPPPGLPNPEEFVDVAYAATQSAGTTQWLAVDLEPGSHVLTCFFPDPNHGGIPHAAEGMAELVTVGDV